MVCVDYLIEAQWCIYASEKPISIASDNGLSLGQHQAIIWTKAWILVIRPLWTNLNEILIEIYTVSYKKIHFKMLSGRWWPYCLGLSVLNM